MGYQVIGASLDIDFECEHCGHSGGATTYDSDELADNSFTLLDFNCPKCGEELEHE